MGRGQKRKEKMAKLRAKNAAARLALIEEALKPKPKRKKAVVEFRELKRKPGMHDATIAADRSRSLKSHGEQVGLGGLGKDTRPVRYDDEALAKREYEAQQEIKRKSKRVAPLYNKSGLHYIGDAPPEVVKGLGRKL